MSFPPPSIDRIVAGRRVEGVVGDNGVIAVPTRHGVVVAADRDRVSAVADQTFAFPRPALMTSLPLPSVMEFQ